MDEENLTCSESMDMENSSCGEKMDNDAGEGKDQGHGNSTQTENPYVSVVKGCEVASEWHMPAPARPMRKPSKCLLPPMENANKKTMVLDLDGTLIRSRHISGLGHDFIISFPKILAQVYVSKRRGAVVACAGSPTFYVSKRPGAEDLLQQLGRLYEIVVFTASGKQYANAVVDELLARFDPEHRVIPATHRLYNQHCTKLEGTRIFAKDLSLLGRDLKNVIFVDDFQPPSYCFQPRNAIPESKWSPSASDDRTLFKILSFCKQIADSSTDVRELIDEYKRGTYD